MFESLENRRLMSATVTQNFLGIVRVEGSDEADQIVVDQVGNAIQVTDDTGNSVVLENVTALIVNGNGGNDTIAFAGSSPFLSLINGNAGSDEIYITDDGSTSIVTGGAGDDTFFLSILNNTIISGGAGNDQFSGAVVTTSSSNGVGLLSGDTGDDYFFVDGGGITALGGAGSDFFSITSSFQEDLPIFDGGAGQDTLDLSNVDPNPETFGRVFRIENIIP